MSRFGHVLLLCGAFLAGAIAGTVIVLQTAPRLGFGAAKELVVDVETRPGQRLRALILRPRKPIGSVILLAGGHGKLDLHADGRIGWGAQNQLIRTRRDYFGRGFVTIVPDIAKDLEYSSELTDAHRVSPAHAQDLTALTAFAAEIAKPVFLVGTSRAALSVANLATRPELRPQPDAIVITSGMLIDVGYAQPSVQRNVRHLERIRGPMLALVHTDDGCPFTPAASAKSFRALASGVHRFDIKSLSGGTPSDQDPCGPVSAHGFYGLDKEVAETIATWLQEFGG